MYQCPSVHGSAGPSATEHEAEVVTGNSGIKRVEIEAPKMSLKVVSADSAGEWHCGIDGGAPQGTDQGERNQQPVKDLQQQQV